MTVPAQAPGTELDSVYESLPSVKSGCAWWKPTATRLTRHHRQPCPIAKRPCR